MAADRPFAERGIVEIKMGRSKFPGKPSKIGNRKRVNLSSCALPNDNDSSKAAKNIYLGLSVFNETFGDNEMVAPGPFHGFSLTEVEDAMAEARLQQNEAYLEHKKQGLNIDFWDSFQCELFSIKSCSSYSEKNIYQINQTKFSFDGGGSGVIEDSKVEKEKLPSKVLSLQNNVLDSLKCVQNSKTARAPPLKKSSVMKHYSPRVKLKKLSSTSITKSLQSQAAKKLLEKAKMSNALDNNKSMLNEKKFILPNFSIRSSRVIKPNKKFSEECALKRKTVKRKLNENVSDFKKYNLVSQVLNDCNDKKQKVIEPKKFNKTEAKSSESKALDSSELVSSNSGKIILREARLQLDNNNISLLEGPFSSPSAPNLSPNSQLKLNSVNQKISSESVLCEVCGVVRFYKVVDLAKKFGIYCCDSCQNFITNIMKNYNVLKNKKVQCLKGKGLCGIVPVVDSSEVNAGTCLKSFRCQACWLKLCLKNFKMPMKLKQKLVSLLPVNIQLEVSLDLNSSLSNNMGSKFKLSNGIKDFKWFKENCKNNTQVIFTSNNKLSNWQNSINSEVLNQKSLRKRERKENENCSKLSTSNNKTKTESEERSRQSIMLKGPRVKHVCRSASVVLGQPLATFSSENTFNKIIDNGSAIDCKDCDNVSALSSYTEPVKVSDKSTNAVASAEMKQEKKLNTSKQISSARISNGPQQNTFAKSKKKSNVKTENPVSMDFWECYDPDEVCETGFGLIGSESFSVRALCFLCGSSGQEKLIHCASCCEPYHEFCVNEGQLKLQHTSWKYDWVCPQCTVCFTCGKTSGQQLKCIKCDNSYHTECVDRVGGRLLYSPDRPWVCSVCLRCKSCNGVDVSVFVGNLPLCKACFILRQKGNYCPLCQRCYEDDDYDSKMMECGQCKCWVHAKCEGLSDEKYQVLSFLPESVEYICRMCCIIPPAPWWVAIEAELKGGYLGVLKTLSKNRKACAMLKWSPRKQCTCRQVNFVSRNLDFEEIKPPSFKSENSSNMVKNDSKSISSDFLSEKAKEENYQPGVVTERKTSIEVINHPTESLKLTLKIMKGSETEEKLKPEVGTSTDNCGELMNNSSFRESKKFFSSNENHDQTLEILEGSKISLRSNYKGNDFSNPLELSEKRLISSPLNPPSDSGIGSTDDELKPNCLTDEESLKLEDQSRTGPVRNSSELFKSVLDEKRECFCFLEVDSYNSRSKPFSPNLMSIKKKVTTSEYTSLQQFHQDMQGMIATTQSAELMELYHQTIKEIFPWFDPKFSRVQSNSQKVSGPHSLESTPVKATPSKTAFLEKCRVPKEKLLNQPLDYFYSDYIVEDNRICLMCKSFGDGPPNDTGRLLYCGQNEWVHCNCALWSGEVFEEIDGSLQNVHSAISRGRSIRCPECNLKGASIGCCARNCQETYHFRCARKIGCIFLDDKTVYCPSHAKDCAGKLVQNEKEFEIRRPVYVELDKRKMKAVDSSQIRFAVGALHVNSLGKFVTKLSDQTEAIVPEQFECTRLYWSCFEPWRIVRYHFTVRVIDMEDDEGIDCGVNLTIDHSKAPEVVDLKLRQLKYFQEHNTLFDFRDIVLHETGNEKLRQLTIKSPDEFLKTKQDEGVKLKAAKISLRDHKVVKKLYDQFDSKDDENCLSDNQNSADLLPPELEEAIFKDLPNDILDGISVQDIFMDIKNDAYDSSNKDIISEDIDTDDLSGTLSCKSKDNNEVNSQLELWTDPNEYKSETSEELPLKLNSKKRKNDMMSSPQLKRSATLRTYQKTCNFNWNHKTEGTNKWKKNSKCHVTVNLLESQDRYNMLQELKLTDGLVTISTGTIDSVKELKNCLDESKCSVQHEEGKENKCLPWHTHLQPRLLQVDGGVDSSSSGSEAGESPQRLTDDTTNSKISLHESPLPFRDSVDYPLSSPLHSVTSSFVPTSVNISSDFHSKFSITTKPSYHGSDSLPQLDGTIDTNSDNSDFEDLNLKVFQCKRQRDKLKYNQCAIKSTCKKIIQCDGGVDSESDECESLNGSEHDNLPLPLETSQTKDEPVKCNQCRCTYRTVVSYQRHLETCCNDFILSSSEEEMSEEESPKRQSRDDIIETEKTNSDVNGSQNDSVVVNNVKEGMKVLNADNRASAVVITTSDRSPDNVDKLEVKKEKLNRRTYTRKKSTQNISKCSSSNLSQASSITVQPPAVPPTLIVQDLPNTNIAPPNFVESSSALRYVTAVDTQNPFGKPQLITTPNGIISGGFQFPSPQDTQIVGGLCLNPQVMQTHIPGIIIQQPHPTGHIIPSPTAPVLISNDQVIYSSNGLFDVIQNPNTTGMFIANPSQPLLYNMETIVSNTVMQTNQFVSNVMATSYSQTSTQIFQAREMEHVINMPSNYIVLASNPPPPPTEKLLSTDTLICVQTPHSLIPSQTPLQVPSQPVFNPTFAHSQVLNPEPKIISSQVSPIRCLQPLQVGSSILVNKITSSNAQAVGQSLPPVFQASDSISKQNVQQVEVKNKFLSSNGSYIRNVPMMRPNVSKSSPKGYEKAVVSPKLKSRPMQTSTALVDYINNFRSDSCDVLHVKEASLNNGKQSFKEQSILEPKTVPLVCQPKSPISTVSTDVPRKVKDNTLDDLQKISALKNSNDILQQPTLSNSTSQFITPSKPALEEAATVPSSNFSSIPTNEQNIANHSTTTAHEKTDFQEKENLEYFNQVKKKESEMFEDKKKEVHHTPNEDDTVSSDISNSFSLSNEVAKNMSLPCLEDLNSINQHDEIISEKPQVSENLVENEKQSGEILPLQDGTQSLNTGSNIKLPQKMTFITHKVPRVEEKKKIKKTAIHDQNIPDPSFSIENVSGKIPGHSSKVSKNRKILFRKHCEEKGPKLIFDVVSDDGFKSSSTSMMELWANICDSVQEMRAVFKIPPLPVTRKGHEILGMKNHGLQHCLEQLKGVENCINYKCKYFIKDRLKNEEDESVEEKENLSGCARTEKFTTRKEYDMFAWLASKHRQLPKLSESAEETLSSIRRANSLPMAMKYRNLKETAKLYLGVYRSKIHGRGLFCLREIEAGEMVIEYAGEVIRSNLTDKREKHYTEKGIGCYMFRIDDHFVVDATMKGNAARFINHSCEPNCYSRVVDILGKKHIVIFALRRISIMEELTYDYKFPFEDEKISCHCLSKKCRKYLN